MQEDKVGNRFIDAVVTLVVGALSVFWLDGALAGAAPVDVRHQDGIGRVDFLLPR